MKVARRKLDFGKILTNVAGLAAGGVGGKLIVRKIAPNLDPKLKAAGVIALGAILPEVAGRNPMLANVGNGMMAVGGAELVGALIPGMAGIYDEFDDDFDDALGQNDEGFEQFDEDLDNAMAG